MGIQHRVLTTVERALIVVVLHDRKGSATDAAVALGISRATMTRLLRKHGIVRRHFQGGQIADVLTAFEVLLSRQFLLDIDRHKDNVRTGPRRSEIRPPVLLPE